MGQILLFSYYSIISIPSEIIFRVSSYRKIYRLNLEYLSYIYRNNIMCDVYLQYLLQLWLMSFLLRAAWNSSRRNFAGCDTSVRLKQTNTDLSGFRLEERGFRVKRVTLAAMDTPHLKANKSRHISFPLLSSASDLST